MPKYIERTEKYILKKQQSQALLQRKGKYHRAGGSRLPCRVVHPPHVVGPPRVVRAPLTSSGSVVSFVHPCVVVPPCVVRASLPLRIAVPPRVHAPFVAMAFPPCSGVVDLVAGLLTRPLGWCSSSLRSHPAVGWFSSLRGRQASPLARRSSSLACRPCGGLVLVAGLPTRPLGWRSSSWRSHTVVGWLSSSWYEVQSQAALLHS